MIKCLFKSSVWKMILACLIVVGGVSEAWAANTNGYLSSTERNCQNIDKMKAYTEKLKSLPISNVPQKDDIEKQRQKVLQQYSKLIQECETIRQAFPSIKNLDVKEKGFISDTKYTDEEYSKKFEATMKNLAQNAGSEQNKKKAQRLYDNYTNYNNSVDQEYMKLLNDYAATGGSKCGENYPFGCANGEKCWNCGSGYGGGGAAGQVSYYKCSSSKPSNSCSETKTSGNSGTTVTNIGGMTGSTTTKINSDGSLEQTHKEVWEVNNNKETTILHKNAVGEIDYEVGTFTNESCHVDQLQESYMGSCYSCVVVSALISTFMQIADKLGPLMQMAGTRLLIIGMPLWLVFYIIQKLVSLVSLEPMKILNDLFKFFFKCLIAYALITSGVRAISQLMVNPLLNAGADYGIGIIDSVMPKNINSSVTSKLNKDSKHYQIAASNNVDQKVFDKIMLISRKADAAVSLNFVIGNAVFCHSYNAGAIRFPLKLTEYLKINFYFPDFWLMLCGALIWFFAFMVTLGVNFYLLDLSFKIGFALLALPVTIGLWPFEKFKDKFGICIKLIANAAGTFMFLGITTGISIALISASLGGTDKLLESIKANQQAYVSQVFGFTGAKFLIVFFAFFYSHKLISETVSKLADKFFGSVLQGATPMANMSTQMVDLAKRGVMKLAGGAAGATVGKAYDATKASVKNAALKVGRKGVQGLRAGGRAATRGAKAVGRAIRGGGNNDN